MSMTDGAGVHIGPVDLVLGGEGVQGFSMAFLVGHGGWSLIDTQYDFASTIGWLLAEVFGCAPDPYGHNYLPSDEDGDDGEYPPVDADGDWIIRSDDRLLTDVALVIVAYDDGAVAAARIPDSTGRVSSKKDIVDALRRVQAKCLDELVDGGPDGSRS